MKSKTALVYVMLQCVVVSAVTSCHMKSKMALVCVMLVCGGFRGYLLPHEVEDGAGDAVLEAGVGGDGGVADPPPPRGDLLLVVQVFMTGTNKHN